MEKYRGEGCFATCVMVTVFFGIVVVIAAIGVVAFMQWMRGG